jgi:hypothetical protein
MFNKYWHIGLLLINFFIAASVHAVTLNLDSIPSSITAEQEFTSNLTINCEKCSDSYFRGVFFSTGSNYFGFTRNTDGIWVASTSDKTLFFKVNADQVQSGTWSGQLKFKPEIENKNYAGPGQYSFKVIRYTSSGNKSSESQVLSIAILGPTNTPIPPTVKPTLKPTTVLPTALPTPISPTNTQMPISTKTISSPQVLAINTESATSFPTVTIVPIIESTPSATTGPFGTILILIGIVSLALSAFMLITPV